MPGIVSRKNAWLDTSSWYLRTPGTMQKFEKLTENQNVIDTKFFTGGCECKMTMEQSIKIPREKAFPRILFSTVSGT